MQNAKLHITLVHFALLYTKMPQDYLDTLDLPILTKSVTSHTVSMTFHVSSTVVNNVFLTRNVNAGQTLKVYGHTKNQMDLSKQETHGPHRSPEKTVQINKHI
mgnify:CR=1 FL=1